MKISIVFTEGAKQIMMTPETDHERKALKFIAPNSELKVVSKTRIGWGTFGDDDKNYAEYQVSKCRGGYYRAFETKDSLMFVIEEPSSQKEPTL